jgi:hypothetical protein
VLKKLIVSVAEKGQNLEEVTMAKTKLQEILTDRDEKIKDLNIKVAEKCQQLNGNEDIRVGRQ